MAKLNWDRVKSERDIIRSGSEYVKNEREIYFRGNGEGAIPLSIHQNKSASQIKEDFGFSPVISTTNSPAKSNDSIKPYSRETVNPNLIEIKVTDNKDGRVKLPSRMFQCNSRKAIINGIIYKGTAGDGGRCKVHANVFKAKAGQIIQFRNVRDNVWTSTVVRKTNQGDEVSNQYVSNAIENKFQRFQIPVIKIPRSVEKSLNSGELQTAFQPPTTIFSPTPFSDKKLRDWFFDSFVPDIQITDSVSTMGAAPFEETDFDTFFNKRGINVYVAGAETEILIIGRENWQKQDLEDLLDKRAGKHLRVYSQEMFLAFWMSGSDPLRNRRIALKFAEGHPALEFLSNIGFDWVDTFVQKSIRAFDEELPKIGILRHSGYKVGITGLVENERQKILSEVFDSELPTVVSHAYMQEWGAPQSKERLQKIANSIAAFCRNEKRKFNPSEIAISEWKTDLSWLRDTYYTGRFTFQFPSVLIA